MNPARTHADIGHRPAPPGVGASILDFMTDGSLPSLCEELASLTQRAIVLRDPDGRRITAAPPPRRWVVTEDEPGHTEIHVPIQLPGGSIGSIEVVAGGERLGPHEKLRLEHILSGLASTVAEVCGNQMELRHRLHEMGVLFEISSLLARAESVDAVLHTGLDSALDVLDLDAGAVVLFEETQDGPLSDDEGDLVLKASRGLSRRWLESPMPLSKGRLFDRLALDGQIVTAEDLRLDPRVQIQEMVEEEGLRAAIHTGLVFNDRPIGVMRLYSRAPRRFTPADERLVRSIGHQLAVAVQQARLLRIQQEDRRIQRQVALAADVQRRMLPRSIPAIDRLDFAATWMPSLELSGDFYDFIPIGKDGALGVLVGDVVGKGMAAAMLMSLVRGSLRAHCAVDGPLEGVMERVNRDLCRDTLEGEFVTLWLGVIDPGSLSLSCCIAGHEPPILVRPGAGEMEVTELSGEGALMGVDRSWAFPSYRVQLEPGDTLIVYSDGLIDSVNFQNERFGRPRLRSAARTAALEGKGSASEVLNIVLRELRQFTGLANRPDDLTAVVMTVKSAG